MTRFMDQDGNPISATDYLATRKGARLPDRWIEQAEREKADEKPKAKKKTTDADGDGEKKEGDE